MWKVACYGRLYKQGKKCKNLARRKGRSYKHSAVLLG